LTIKEIRAFTGLSQIKFCEQYGIPRRTLENWEKDIPGQPPEYIARLLERVVKMDFCEKLK